MVRFQLGEMLLIDYQLLIISDYNLLILHSLIFQCDGCDEVVFCAWDGQTYIVDHAQEVVRFQLGENAAAFTAGKFNISISQIQTF